MYRCGYSSMANEQINYLNVLKECGMIVAPAYEPIIPLEIRVAVDQDNVLHPCYGKRQIVIAPNHPLRAIQLRYNSKRDSTITEFSGDNHQVLAVSFTNREEGFIFFLEHPSLIPHLGYTKGSYIAQILGNGTIYSSSYDDIFVPIKKRMRNVFDFYEELDGEQQERVKDVLGKGEHHWWDSDNLSHIFLCQADEPVLMMSFPEYKAELERLLGRELDFEKDRDRIHKEVKIRVWLGELSNNISPSEMQEAIDVFF